MRGPNSVTNGCQVGGDNEVCDHTNVCSGLTSTPQLLMAREPHTAVLPAFHGARHAFAKCGTPSCACAGTDALASSCVARSSFVCVIGSSCSAAGVLGLLGVTGWSGCQLRARTRQHAAKCERCAGCYRRQRRGWRACPVRRRLEERGSGCAASAVVAAVRGC